jgi:hypothetical protein
MSYIVNIDIPETAISIAENAVLLLLQNDIQRTRRFLHIAIKEISPGIFLILKTTSWVHYGQGRMQCQRFVMIK